MKIIGYFASWDKPWNLEQFNYEYLTHINYAFFVPCSNGAFVDMDEKEVFFFVNEAHKHDVKVFLSVGGWSYKEKRLDKVFQQICDDKVASNLFLSNLFAIVRKFHFDGVDLDWEYPTLKYQKQYENLLVQIKESLGDKPLSIAIPPGINIDGSIQNIEAITDKVLNTVDWVNLMVYDNPLEENHSSYSYATLALDYWLDIKKYSKKKIVLGVPFYSNPSGILYREIIKLDSKNAKKDNYRLENYNGISLMEKKAKLAKERCSGLMIWAINYDSLGQNSLLKCIHDTVKKN